MVVQNFSLFDLSFHGDYRYSALIGLLILLQSPRLACRFKMQMVLYIQNLPAFHVATHNLSETRARSIATAT
jgi:hypothetical protein